MSSSLPLPTDAAAPRGADRGRAGPLPSFCVREAPSPSQTCAARPRTRLPPRPVLILIAVLARLGRRLACLLCSCHTLALVKGASVWLCLVTGVSLAVVSVPPGPALASSSPGGGCVLRAALPGASRPTRVSSCSQVVG